MDCPGDLNCNGGFCCEGDELCGGGDGDGDGDGDTDAGTDATPLAFTDHLTPYTCDGNTVALYHFDEMPFANAGGCLAMGVPEVVQSPFIVASRDDFDMAVNLGGGAQQTRFVEAPTGANGEIDTGAMTIEAWFDIERPASGRAATIVSALRPVAGQTLIESAAFYIGLAPDGRLRVELFEKNDCNQFFNPDTGNPEDNFFFFSNNAIPSGMHHVRLVVAPNRVTLYVDALVDKAFNVPLSSICTNPEAALLGIGSVDNGLDQEFDGRLAPTGRIDEVRYSNIAR